MNTFVKRPHLLLGLFFLGLLTASCQTTFIVREQASYTGFRIDSTVQPDPAITTFYAPYKAQLDAEMSRTVGHTDVDLTKPSDSAETRMGNFFADVLLAEGRKQFPDALFAFGTKGGLRIELPRGEITVGNIFELMPFENELVMLEITGESVRQLAEFIAATGGQPVSGIRLTIDDGHARDIQIGGEPLDPTRNYKLITYDYLANGGDHVRGLENPIQRAALGAKVREVLMTHIQELQQAGKHVNTSLDGRITRLQQ